MDRLLTGITINSGNRNITFQEGSSVASFNLSTGTYYAYRGSIPGFPSLYNAIEQGMNDASPLGNTYEIRSSKPTGYALDTAVSIHRVTGPFQFRLNDTSTFPLEYLSRPSGVTTPFTGATGILPGLHSAKGVWCPTGLLGLSGATDRRGGDVKDIRFSDEDTRRAYTLRVRSGRYRTITWRYVHATSIFMDRANRTEYITASQIGLGDNYNALERYWSQLGESGSVGLKPFLILWFPFQGVPTTNESDDYSISQVADPKFVQDFSSLIRLEQIGGEYYEVTLPIWDGSSIY